MAPKINTSNYRASYAKGMADGAAYFNLFKPHIPTGYDRSKKVMLYMIDNLACIVEIVKMNPEAQYTIVSNDDALSAVLKRMLEGHNVEYKKEFNFTED